MASRAQLITYCGMVDRAQSIDVLRSVVADYPELIHSQMGCAAIMKAIPRVIINFDEKYFDYRFIMTIVDQYRCRALGGYRDHVREMATVTGASPHDWALDILRCYARQMILHTEGKCLSFPDVSHNFDEFFKEKGIESPQVILGYIFFVFDYSKGNTFMTDKAFKLFMRKFCYMEALMATIQTFCDACCPASSRAVEVLSRIICIARLMDPNFGNETLYSRVKDGSFLKHAMDTDTGWIATKLNEYDDANIGQPDEEIISQVINIFTMLSNALQDRFITENFFFEYISEISYYYPLEKQRMDTAARYEKYFGAEALNYMCDLTEVIYEAVSKVDNYRDPQQDQAATRIICMAVEEVVLKLHHQFPDVSPKVVELFLSDTMNCFGRGFRGFSEGIMWSIGDMIQKIYDSDQQVMESDFDYVDFLYAMEAGDLTDGNAGSAVDTAKLHKKATNVKNSAKNMKAAERKIFNAYHKYKSNEEKVDQTLAKGINALKKAVVGDQQKILIEGKPFSPIGFLKKVILTVGLFNYNKIAAILAIIVGKTMKSKARKSEKRQLIMELEEELMMVNEKIEDARGDGNRQAKYDLMRTRNAIQNAIKRLKYGIAAEEKNGQFHNERLTSTQNYKVRNLRG